MRRIFFVLVSVIAFGGLTASSANAAVSPHSASAVLAGHPAHAVGLAVEPSVTCSTLDSLTNVYNGGGSWNSTISPYTLWIQNLHPDTQYCKQGSKGNYQFVQYGTSRCLFVDTLNRTIIESNCADVRAHWNLISVDGGEYTELQNDDNLACIWENGLNQTATFKPCDATNTQDLFYSAGLI